MLEINLGRTTVLNHLILMEEIRQGERIRAYVVEGLVDGKWKEICHGQSVGHKRIEEFPDVEVTQVRLTVTESVATPLLRDFSLYRVTPLTTK